ncbi:AT-rich interactive domain-containing protein 1 isoform X1 [Vigna radiata var. radiata]|uniref:AT-rich interactive domain-containing protein 1 isoform X1 n=1 Tax=Vigna radiata var. radiata TaxID=3916 RepID=A0A1S3TRN0_VIGRR|nr:AT-rich interactive domain-containing protein 1 isoform X1 [Vigna radiata var. radiata]XP_022635626.1 AT-rich interactive domain-containing protein 1 isoform X1 [Vigna radiata var. radiata]XP_022635627.1 AT-rich interactive domain-containing protein 1 isoform X1 [Vigna radiata var. radiata]
MMGNGDPLDLYKLFMVVKKKGGYDAVCKNRLWDLVGEEYGLGVKVGSDVEHVYSKHLSALETCLKNVAGGKFAEYGLEGDRVKFQKHLMEAHTESMLDDSGEEEVGDEHERRECGCPDGRKLSGSNRVKCVKPESNGAEQESAYKYIDRSKSCGSNSVKDKNTNSNGNEYDNVCDYLEGRKFGGTNRVNGVNPDFNEAKKVRRPELVDLDMLEDHDKGEPIVVKFCGFNTEMDTPEEFDESKLLTVDASDAESDMLRLSDGSKSNNKDDDDDSEVLILDPSSVDKKKFGHKRKRESVSEMLIWINSIAKNPCDPAVGSIPEKSKWKSCSSQEIWKQALLFREAVFLKKDFETANEQLSWQSQKMHPSMYDDRVEALYNFRKRLKCEEKSLLGTSTSDGVSSTSSKTKARGNLERTSSSRSENVVDKKLHDSCSLDKYARVHIPVGPNHQAEVPEWTGITCESDSKWLGTQIWPPKFVNSKSCLIERDPIGKGRQDSCGCPVQGSVECVRFHVGEKRSKVKMELGEAFFQWRLDMVGEEVSSSWTDEDEKKFRDVVKSNPASLDKCFWDHLFKTFPKKSREDLVCYYFNVFLLQQRAYQNRHTPDNIDSDDDESEFTPLRKVFGHQTPKSRNLTLLSPKKSTGKRSNSK